ncbi:MAG: zinc ribbon domain-containing protein [Deltaproteobacteria bacterium]|nr:zinc ribbon domain-containing protein [Deltaproteobacteria bacterium]
MPHDAHYRGQAAQLSPLLDRLESRFSRSYETQTLRFEDGDALRQAIFQVRSRYRGDLGRAASQLLGFDLAATVTLDAIGDDLKVSVGGARWLDKVAVAGVGLFISLGVLWITAGIGALQQRDLLSGLSRECNKFLGRQPPPAPEAPATSRPSCGACGAALPAGARFCHSCGQPTGPAPCPACGAETAPDAAFCGACGASLRGEE